MENVIKPIVHILWSIVYEKNKVLYFGIKFTWAGVWKLSRYEYGSIWRHSEPEVQISIRSSYSEEILYEKKKFDELWPPPPQ